MIAVFYIRQQGAISQSIVNSTLSLSNFGHISPNSLDTRIYLCTICCQLHLTNQVQCIRYEY